RRPRQTDRRALVAVDRNALRRSRLLCRSGCPAATAPAFGVAAVAAGQPLLPPCGIASRRSRLDSRSYPLRDRAAAESPGYARERARDDAPVGAHAAHVVDLEPHRLV